MGSTHRRRRCRRVREWHRLCRVVVEPVVGRPRDLPERRSPGVTGDLPSNSLGRSGDRPRTTLDGALAQSRRSVASAYEDGLVKPEISTQLADLVSALDLAGQRVEREVFSGERCQMSGGDDALLLSAIQ